jgi:hypothetical protein
MKNASYFIILFLFSVKLFAQEIKESEVPAAVVSSFKDKFSPEGKTSWTKDAGIYTISFKSEGQNVKASFSSEGNWADTRYEIAYKELPGQVVSYITTNFKDAKIKESSLRESAEESNHYYIVLKKEGITSTAELYFDMKGTFTKQNVPDNFMSSVAGVQTTVNVPDTVYTAFKAKFPEAAITSWKTDSLLYTAIFTNDEMAGRAEYTADGTWHSAKYTVSEKELPGPISSDLKANYLGYKIKTCEMVQEPATTDYYYLFAKKEGIGQPSVELYYTLTGKLIKKVASEEKSIEEETQVSDKNTTTKEDEIENSTVTISAKELPSKIISYIKKNYYGYSIKEAVTSTTEKGTYYYVKIKKEGKKKLTELSFDVNGKYLEEKAEETE